MYCKSLFLKTQSAFCHCWSTALITSVGYPLCDTQMEILSQEIDSIIIGRNAVAAQTQHNLLAQLRRLCKLTSLSMFFLCLLAAGVCHYPAMSITTADSHTKKNNQDFYFVFSNNFNCR